jgi:hypothetical protein
MTPIQPAKQFAAQPFGNPASTSLVGFPGSLVFYSDKMLNINPARRQTRQASPSNKVRSRQGRRSVPSASISSRLDDSSRLKIEPLAFPCHRLIPRSRDELRALRAYVANLGKHLASAVFANGELGHLFEVSFDSFLIVSEWLFIEEGKDRYGLAEALEARRMDLAEYLERHPRVKLWRAFTWAAKSKSEVTEWIEKTGVAASLSAGTLERFFGSEEVGGMANGRLILERDTRDGNTAIWVRAGKFLCENQTARTWRPMTRLEVLEALRFRLLDSLEGLLPESFRDDFTVSYWDTYNPADPADVIP